MSYHFYNLQLIAQILILFYVRMLNQKLCLNDDMHKRYHHNYELEISLFKLQYIQKAQEMNTMVFNAGYEAQQNI